MPRDAVVFVNSKRTAITGEQRVYYSNALKAGNDYKYTVRAQVVRDGRIIEDTKQVILRLGDSRNLVFDLPGRGDDRSFAQISQ